MTPSNKLDVYTVESSTSEEGLLLTAAVKKLLQTEDASNELKVAFDCEGVNLSRLGTVEIVSLAFKKTSSTNSDDDEDAEYQVFLVDLGGGKIPNPDIVETLKDLFESTQVTKIIHDCRMDCDALYHLHGITVSNVHDTSCFHTAIFGSEDRNLNDVLLANNIRMNAAREKSVYHDNPNFWKTRPFTSKMIEWASSDVNSLFDLASKQLHSIRESTKARATSMSQANTTSARDMQVKTDLHVRNPRSFIGRGGQNIRSLQRRTGTLIYSQRPAPTWFVYYPSSSALEVVKRKMNAS